MKRNQMKICVKELTEEIKLLLKEEWIGTFNERQDALFVRFTNGQSFRIAVEEVK